MSAKMGRPTLNKKTVRFELRMAPDEAADLQYCAEQLQVSRAQVINKGIQLVKAELEKAK